MCSFSPSCSDQVPGYIQKYDEFKSKGVKEVYVIAVNDMFVMQAWRKKLLADNGKEGQETSTVKFGKLPLLYTHTSRTWNANPVQSVMTPVLSDPPPDSSLTLPPSSVDPDSSEPPLSFRTARLSTSLLRTPHQRVSDLYFCDGYEWPIADPK